MGKFFRPFSAVAPSKLIFVPQKYLGVGYALYIYMSYLVQALIWVGVVGGKNAIPEGVAPKWER